MSHKKSPVTLAYEWWQHFLAISPIVPPSIIGVITASISIVLGWSAPLVVIFALAAALIAFAVLFIAPSARSAYIAIGGIVSGALLLTWQQYNNYTIEPVDVRAGLIPTDSSFTQAAGVRVSLTFVNKNDFPLYLISDRRVSSVDTPTGPKISPSEQKSYSFVRKANSTFGVSDEPIMFTPAIDPHTFAGGTIDWHLCYGRAEGHLNKALTVKGRYWPEFSNGMSIKWDASEIKYGPCD